MEKVSGGSHTYHLIVVKPNLDDTTRLSLLQTLLQSLLVGFGLNNKIIDPLFKARFFCEKERIYVLLFSLGSREFWKKVYMDRLNASS